MRLLLTVLATLAVIGVLALVFPYTGLYNVAASEGDSAVEQWYLSTLSRRSIAVRADEVAVPADLADSTRIVRGAVAFRQMCQTCHGAPGVERGVTGQGLTPTPPRLSEAATRWAPGEVFWILQHGIKMAGMPAYGETHTEEELWALVAFVERLPETTPERYAALTAPAAPNSTGEGAGGAPPGHEGHDHTH